MATWKWGLVAIPAVSGIAIGAQKFSSLSSEELPPPEPYIFNEKVSGDWEDTQDLEEDPDSKESYIPTVEDRGRAQLTRGSQPVDPKFTVVKAESDSAFKKLDDYTFKLFSPCNVGTGWILDYQLPDKEGDYPLVWYIATNAHVVEKWFFDPNKTYGQKLPVDKKWLKGKSFGINSKHTLFTDESCGLKGKGQFDINLAKWNDGQEKKSNRGAIGQNKMKAPRLFWSAVNLFNADNSMDIRSNNYNDFAVVEIEFTDQASAREITRNFADTYKNGYAGAINVLGHSLDIDQTEKNEENFYTLGYPYYKNDTFKYSWNVNSKNFVADRLTKKSNSVAFHLGGRKVVTNPKGYVGAQSYEHLGFKWGGVKYQRMGHFYLMNGRASGKGSSGSMYIDGKGNLIGIKSLAERSGKTQNSMVTPLRSKRIVLDGHFKTPEYDLISGGYNHQRSSYKKQVENHILKNGKKTWLSERAGWKRT